MNHPSLHCCLVTLSILVAFSLLISITLESRRLLLSATQIFSGPPINVNTQVQVASRSENVFSTLSQPTLAVVIPLNSYGLSDLRNALSFFGSPSVRQVLLLCPESISLEVEHSLRDLILSEKSSHHAVYSIIPRRNSDSLVAAVFESLSSSNSDWILVTDERGLEDIDPTSQELLLHPTSLVYPKGPRGIRLSSTEFLCLSPSSSIQTASYLVPPFVMPTNVVRGLGGNPQTWQEFGEIVSKCMFGEFGGLVFPLHDSDTRENQDWCNLNDSGARSSHISNISSNEILVEDIGRDQPVLSERLTNVFITIFSTLEELRLFAPVICSLQSNGTKVHNLLDTRSGLSYDRMRTGSCVLEFKSLMSVDIHSGFDPNSTVLITLAEMDHRIHGATNIHISRKDLPYCSWMASLTEAEWRDWHRPRLTISVITKDRPSSLARLLSSISSGLFFGDSIDMRIHLEQSADYETTQVVKRFSWRHGSLFVHHRIIHGGLLPAVVESWYPHTNDSYGLLLEDDVELSPLFYPWIKMSLLRYRYGESIGKYPNLFGISLYQQKSIELHPDGRRSFNASHIFLENDIPKFSPYFSQIPCSWGAVYFPEHWSEFHDYLAIRFSEITFKLDNIVVPDVRSNRWTKSWKKFFIELVFLRAYVMLYPNFPDYISLSTNHLEVGSHVKLRTKAKQEAFSVPLMQLPVNGKQILQILDLPGGTLPVAPPVLNLTGFLSTIDALTAVGASRRTEMLKCDMDVRSSPPFDARTLLCLS
ncbi:hypothetical protein E1B28_007513 [Marasmius oreades]|uniref:Uncharacterized protein n=1 Tax=Marasmius oreades TaxID=181124 RepID=A0A9P7UVU6_9AGAR|nr:uncharacterized protein E1B28_007513 [Marasmius oreades]KAG7093874.1 hypothetical protein E1B28_007513 [Marasmius oreades]